jgi:hypothetical protein
MRAASEAPPGGWFCSADAWGPGDYVVSGSRYEIVVDTSQGFDAARAQVRAILAAVATMPKVGQVPAMP